jgi:hypothetical protein
MSDHLPASDRRVDATFRNPVVEQAQQVNRWSADPGAPRTPRRDRGATPRIAGTTAAPSRQERETSAATISGRVAAGTESSARRGEKSDRLREIKELMNKSFVKCLHRWGQPGTWLTGRPRPEPVPPDHHHLSPNVPGPGRRLRGRRLRGAADDARQLVRPAGLSKATVSRSAAQIYQFLPVVPRSGRGYSTGSNSAALWRRRKMFAVRLHADSCIYPRRARDRRPRPDRPSRFDAVDPEHVLANWVQSRRGYAGPWATAVRFGWSVRIDHAEPVIAFRATFFLRSTPSRFRTRPSHYLARLESELDMTWPAIHLGGMICTPGWPLWAAAISC